MGTRHVRHSLVAAGYPAKEIARITGSTTPAVHVQLSRARKRLRELLETDDA
jgi:DNA-directed RNA polymerase specialized sigma24 family protein